MPPPHQEPSFAAPSQGQSAQNTSQGKDRVCRWRRGRDRNCCRAHPHRFDFSACWRREPCLSHPQRAHIRLLITTWLLYHLNYYLWEILPLLTTPSTNKIFFFTIFLRFYYRTVIQRF